MTPQTGRLSVLFLALAAVALTGIHSASAVYSCRCPVLVRSGHDLAGPRTSFGPGFRKNPGHWTGPLRVRKFEVQEGPGCPDLKT